MNDYCDNINITNYAVKYNWFMYPVHDNAAFIKYPMRWAEYLVGLKRALSQIEEKIDLKTVDIIHTNNCGLDIGMLLSDKYHIPHIWHLREHGFKPFRFKPFRFNVIQYMTKSPHTTFVAVSETTKAEWARLGIPKERIIVSYDGVQPCEKMPKRQKNDIVRFVMCGAISETKGVDLVIKAIVSLTPEKRKLLSLDLWGTVEPNYKRYIESLIQNNQLERIVKIRGFSNDIWDTLSNYDIGINCTNFEAFGRCTVEYLMSGMPVLAANTGANTEIITHEKNGFVFDRQSLKSLTTGLMYFTEHINKYNTKSKDIRNNAIKKFSAIASSERLVEIFRGRLK